MSGIFSRDAQPKLGRARVGLAGYQQRGCPTVFWDLFGEQGHRVRATVSEMGPVLLARLLGLNETQEGVLAVAFEVADDQGLLLLDLKDPAGAHELRGRARERAVQYGRVSTSSVGAIQRKLLMLEQQGGDHSSRAGLDIQELMRTDLSGQGIINVLAADRLMSEPKLYATFLLWLLWSCSRSCPRSAIRPSPGSCSSSTRRISCSRKRQSPLGQGRAGGAPDPLQGRGRVLLHPEPCSTSRTTSSASWATGCSTPCARSRPRPAGGACGRRDLPRQPQARRQRGDHQLGVGEALVSTLHDKGVPSIVERTLICPPSSRIGPATAEERQTVASRSPVGGRYDQPVDRESAYEVLRQRASVWRRTPRLRKKRPARPRMRPPRTAAPQWRQAAPEPARGDGHQRRAASARRSGGSSCAACSAR